MEKDRLKFCIERYDHYYDSVNNKSNVLLALGVFTTGGLVSLYPFLHENVNCTWCVYFLLGLEIALGITALLVSKMATTPYMSSNASSLHYFGSIANLSSQQFATLSSQMTDQDELTDLRNQVSSLAKGLQSKFSKLRLASVLFIIQFALFFPLVIILVINFKN